MKDEKFKALITATLAEFLASDAGRAAVGQIVLDAIRQWINGYQIDLEEHHRDGKVEVKKFTGDPLAHAAMWIKNAEGAMRGCQQDIAKTMNTSAGLAQQIEAMAGVLVNLQPAILASVNIYQLLNRSGHLSALESPDTEPILIKELSHYEENPY